LRFLGIVSAVVVANLITLVLIAIAFALLVSNQGQAFMRQLGYDISPLISAYHQTRVKEWKDPRLARMTSIEITPQPKAPEPVQPKPAPRNTGQKASHQAIQTTLSSCRFWNNEYRKDGTDSSKAYRDAACGRYERLSGNDVNNVVVIAKAPQRQATTQQISNLQSRQSSTEDHQRENYCDRLREKVDYYDAKLRAGGDGSYMTY